MRSHGRLEYVLPALARIKVLARSRGRLSHLSPVSPRAWAASATKTIADSSAGWRMESTSLRTALPAPRRLRDYRKRLPSSQMPRRSHRRPSLPRRQLQSAEQSAGNLRRSSRRAARQLVQRGVVPRRPWGDRRRHCWIRRAVRPQEERENVSLRRLVVWLTRSQPGSRAGSVCHASDQMDLPSAVFSRPRRFVGDRRARRRNPRPLERGTRGRSPRRRPHCRRAGRYRQGVG